MPRLANQVPTYRLHKQSGHAIVTLGGRDHLLGKYGSADSRNRYSQLIGEWLLGGRQLPSRNPDPTIAELIASYREHVLNYYRRPDGSSTTEVRNIVAAMRILREA